MKDLVDLVIIIDRSGSMHSLKDDVIGGYNALIEEQKKVEGCLRVTTVFFNDTIKYVHDGVDIKEIDNIDNRSYVPRGCTALLDAIGDSISKIKNKQLLDKEIPSKTIFYIMTDGLENASREYSYSTINKAIEAQKELGWEFIFMAANINVKEEASRLGIDLDMAMEFSATKNGIRNQFLKASKMVDNLRKK